MSPYADLTLTPRTLLGPGPSGVHPRVLQALAYPPVGHLDPQFLALINEVQDLLRFVFETQNPLTIPVSGTGSTTLFRHSTRTWLLKMRSLNADTPEEFVKAWDRTVNKLQGFGVIEAKRADTIASGILKASEKSIILLAVVEVERAGEVSELLEDLGCQPLH